MTRHPNPVVSLPASFALLVMLVSLSGCSCGEPTAEASFAQVSLGIGQSLLAYTRGLPVPPDGRFVCADRPMEYARDYTVGMQLPADAHVIYVVSDVNSASFAGSPETNSQASVTAFVTPDGQLTYGPIVGYSTMPMASASRVLEQQFPEALALSMHAREFMLEPQCPRPQRFRAEVAQALGVPAGAVGHLLDGPDTSQAYQCEAGRPTFAKPELFHLRDDIRFWVGIASSTTIVELDLYIRQAGERACIFISGAIRRDPTTGAIVPWRS